MADKHAIVERQLVDGEFVGTKRVAILIDEQMDNGCVVKLKGLKNGEMNLYEVEPVAKDTPLNQVFLVASPEVMKDERLSKSLDEFYNIKGTVGNADRLIEGNIFGLTAEAFSGTPQVGKIVELEAGKRQLKVVDTPTASTTTVGKIVDFVRGYYGIQIG